ncbi:MAG: histidinol-phosphate transaminase [Verrucomicrobia bacterium]|nr:histidinol-phosphate transaminase [Verrucomicrobiota bacterium]
MSSRLPAANPHVAAMSPYVPGEQPQGGGWVKLNTNENPYPPSLRALEAVRVALVNDGAALRLYPSPDSAPLREAAGRFHGFDAAHVVAGNGSDDILNLLIRAYAGPGRPIGMLNPSYSLYPVLAAAQHAEVVKVEVTDALGVDVDAVAKCGAAVFFLTNPNAPLGVAFGTEVVRSLAKAFPGLLVVDEAYAAFADADCVALVSEFPNVVVTRTLSKAHALAGLRVGYALCPPLVAEVLHRVRDSYNVDRLAQVAAAAALDDREWLDVTVAQVRATRDRLAAALRKLGWQVNPAAGNFVLAAPVSTKRAASVETAAHCFEFLRARKILVRRFPNHRLTEKSLRISVGTEQETDVFLQAVAAWMEG